MTQAKTDELRAREAQIEREIAGVLEERRALDDHEMALDFMLACLNGQDGRSEAI